VAGGCVSNLVSLAGTSDMGLLLAEIECGANVVGDNRQALVDSSPITFAGAVRTPTLVLQGEEDHRCPVSQAEEWFSALRVQKVPVEMVRYPGASHLFILNGRPSHRVDYGRRIHEWVVRHTRSEGVKPRTARPELARRLSALIERHGVPGASVAVLANGDITTASAGVLNTETGVAATDDSFFQIGSITKVYTATAVMQLVDEGRIDLDAPIVESLPDLELADPEVAKSVTMRHLLSHTSGIDGDHFLDTGRGDDCVARLVASCAELGQTHPLGATMSYCNTGFTIAGRVLEVLTDSTWDVVMRERIFEPLGLAHSVTLPEEVLRGRAAIGHIGPPGQARPAPRWELPRAGGPAGRICSTASDVVEFARMHLAGGQARSGQTVLSAESAAAMRQPQVAIPNPYTLGSHWGLGWILFDWDGREVFGHDGNTIGQSAYLRVVPDRDVAIALVANGGNAQDLYRDLYSELLEEMAGLTIPPRPAPPAEAAEPTVDLDRHVGVYERLGFRLEVTRDGDHLHGVSQPTGNLAALVPSEPTSHELIALDQDLFVTRQPGQQTWNPMVFFRLPDGTPYVHFGARATPKVSG
jgi:CubicO group peptidase (beta-lactamase class C family)